jgi:hypothetical protein
VICAVSGIDNHQFSRLYVKSQGGERENDCAASREQNTAESRVGRPTHENVTRNGGDTRPWEFGRPRGVALNYQNQ